MTDQQLWAQFAGQALTGIAAGSGVIFAMKGAPCEENSDAEMAARCADAMLAEFRKRFPEETAQDESAECEDDPRDLRLPGRDKLIGYLDRLAAKRAKQIEKLSAELESARTGADR